MDDAKKKGASGSKGRERRKPMTKSLKAVLQFPVGYQGSRRRADTPTGTGAPIYLAAVLECLVEILELTGNVARDNKNKINPRHRGDHCCWGGVLHNNNPAPVLFPKKTVAVEGLQISPKKSPKKKVA